MLGYIYSYIKVAIAKGLSTSVCKMCQNNISINDNPWAPIYG